MSETKLDEAAVETPGGWERGRHCGYLAFYRGDHVVYASPKGHGWVRVLLPKGATFPVTSSHYERLAAAGGGRRWPGPARPGITRFTPQREATMNRWPPSDRPGLTAAMPDRSPVMRNL